MPTNYEKAAALLDSLTEWKRGDTVIVAGAVDLIAAALDAAQAEGRQEQKEHQGLPGAATRADSTKPTVHAEGQVRCGTCEHLMVLHPDGRCVMKDCRCVDGCRQPSTISAQFDDLTIQDSRGTRHLKVVGRFGGRVAVRNIETNRLSYLRPNDPRLVHAEAQDASTPARTAPPSKEELSFSAVREAHAEALEQAIDGLVHRTSLHLPEAISTIEWLRARAAALRAETHG